RLHLQPHLRGHRRPSPTPTFGPTGSSTIPPVVFTIITVGSTRILILGTWLIKTLNTLPILMKLIDPSKNRSILISSIGHQKLIGTIKVCNSSLVSLLIVTKTNDRSKRSVA
uniref:Uncharacterized protein n=1 Tax=Anopheles maculatus TaxID=74869 RepID=A0A182T812_9DIPT